MAGFRSVFRSTGEPIKLRTRGGTGLTSIRGVSYAIEYPVKSGYKYSISLNTFKIDDIAQSNAIINFEIGARPTLPTSGTSPTACGSVLLNAQTSVQSAKISEGSIASKTASNVTALQNWVSPDNRSFFTILVYGGNNGEDATVFINSITITEIPPPSNFSITPSTLDITCGTTNPQTFTVNNLNNTPNVTGYIWEMPVNSGWIYNGAPATSEISTTSNSITLTPVCGLHPNNFRVRVYGSSTTSGPTDIIGYTNFVTSSIISPTYSISGLSSICSGNTNYSINGLLCNSTVLWTAPPSNLATLNSLTTSPTTLTSSTGTSGNFTLTANVTSCGVTSPVTLPIKVGNYTSSDYIMYGGNSTTQPLYWCPNQTYSFSVNGPGSNYQWTIPAGWTINYNGGYVLVLKAPTSSYPPTGTVSVSFTEPCGTTITKSFFTSYSSSACIGTDPRFTYSPNPAPSYLNVAVASGYIGTVYIRRIQIINVNTGITVFDQTYGGNASSAYITTSVFQTGTYSLRIYDGSGWASYQFLR